VSEREKNLILLSILGLAFVLRVWAIGFGLPYDFTPDEVHEIVRALKLGTGEYSWTPGKGGLYLFLFVEYGLLYVFWWITGQVNGPTDFALAYLQDPTAFYLAGRITVAVMGTATCYVIYLIGKRLYDWRIGLAAAFIGATAHYHGLWSHYINVDIGMTLALWAAILAYIVYEKDPKLRWLIAAGALGGISFAFKSPGAIVAVPLLLAIATPFDKWSRPRKPVREASIVMLSMLITSLAVAPENVLSFGKFAEQFSSLLGGDGVAASADAFDKSVKDVTVFRGGSYLKILFRDTNIALTLAALLGVMVAFRRRERWDLIWVALIAVFMGVMILADRPGEQRYLLPIIPALWLLGARAATVITGTRTRLLPIAMAIIVAVPAFALVQQNHSWTRPDTRVLTKDWIESNVPPGSKFLMDGMRFRFIHSPPLQPDEITVNRRIDRAEAAGSVSRGISGGTLELYAKAMRRMSGPKYELHSTIYGLKVRELSYYIDECFDYIVTSSQNSNRFLSAEAAERYPTSASFYQDLPTDIRFEKIFSATPAPWRVQGPEINVYKVLSNCE